MPGDGIVRLLLEPLFEDFHRLVDLAEGAVRQRQQPSSFGVLRPERDDLAEADDRFVRPLLAVQQDAQVGVRVRVVGIDANGRSIGRLRFNRLALGPQDHTEIVVRIGMIRLERDRALERDDRLVQLQTIPQDDPQIAVPVRPIGLELETSLDQRDRLLAPPLLVGEYARVVQRVGIVWRDLEDAAVDVVRRLPLLVLLQPDRDRYRFFQADRTVFCRPLVHLSTA